MNISNRLISTAARQRAAALLKELSLEEKVRQLGCTMLVSEDTDLTAKDLSGGIAQDAAGSAKARVLGGSAVQVGLRQLDEIL